MPDKAQRSCPLAPRKRKRLLERNTGQIEKKRSGPRGGRNVRENSEKKMRLKPKRGDIPPREVQVYRRIAQEEIGTEIQGTTVAKTRKGLKTKMCRPALGDQRKFSKKRKLAEHRMQGTHEGNKGPCC